MRETDKTTLGERLSKLSPEKLELLVRSLEAQAQADARPAREPIALIGAACRFPGGADGLESYWRLLRDGVCATGEIPPTRWDVEAYYDRAPDAAGKMYTRHGGFLADIDRADFRFFNIDPKEAQTVDPHQLLLLEVAWEALEDAGIAADGLAGSPTGVFLGIGGSDHGRRLLAQNGAAVLDENFATGTMSSIAAGRLSYALGLQGPCMALDTACSSSLVALHLACRSLQDQECDLSLVGGVHLLLSPEMYISLCRAQALAPDGQCKSFDAAANGYVRGEGCGVVVLKRLSNALSHGDNILAVIRGSAINQGGRGNGLRAPNGLAQEMVMRQALESAGVDPAQIAYVEAHGTASLMGDAIELTALGNALTLGGETEASPCGVGSVKGNLGHLEIASGMASLLKAALILKHRQIPATLHFTQPNPQVDWARSRLRVQRAQAPLPDDGEPAIVGINSFSWSGTNAFVILEEPPRPRTLGERAAHAAPGLLVLSARTLPALRALASQYQKWLAADEGIPLQDIFYRASVQRTHHEHRLALTARSREELVQRLDTFLEERRERGVAVGRRSPRGRPKVAFLFMDDDAVEPHGSMEDLKSWPALRELFTLWEREPYHRVDAYLVQQLAAALLLRSWGIVPDVVIGGGRGELAAAHLAGTLSLEDALAPRGSNHGKERRGPPVPRFETATMPWFSLSLGRFWQGVEDSDLWTMNPARAGDLHGALSAALPRGPRMLIEIGPSSRELAGRLEGAVVLPGWEAREPALEALARVLGDLYIAGASIDWRRVYSGSGRHVRLPPYPWQRERLGVKREE